MHLAIGGATGKKEIIWMNPVLHPPLWRAVFFTLIRRGDEEAISLRVKSST
jgi:acetaldehyde dehydrogenase (acetylating)